MGSATSQALVAAREVLTGAVGRSGLTIGQSLFAVANAMSGSAQLRAALADPAADAQAKQTLVAALFPKATAGATAVLASVVSSRWSSQDDLIAGIDELGIRAVAASAPKTTSVADELFTFARAVSSDAELELGLGSKLGSREAKRSLVVALLQGRASAQTQAIVEQLVANPRGARIGQSLAKAAALVADQAGQRIALVITASALAPAQLERLRAGLSAGYGTDLKLNQIVDPSIIGGVRVQIGDDVIDGSVSTRLNELRLALVG